MCGVEKGREREREREMYGDEKRERRGTGWGKEGGKEWERSLM